MAQQQHQITFRVRWPLLLRALVKVGLGRLAARLCLVFEK